MKIIINESERGFLFKNGVYRKMLQPGKHRIRTCFGETYVRTALDKPINVPGTDPEVLLRDPAFADTVVAIDVPDGYVGIKTEDGLVKGALGAGKHYFFNVYKEVAALLFDFSAPEICGLTPEQIDRLPKELYQKLTIGEGEIGLLFLDGKFSRALNAGAYYFWNAKTAVTCEKFDLRSQELEINGQEILTADKVTLRVNFICNYSITDPVKLYNEVKNYKERVYTLTQLALRDYIGKFRFDELLEQKDTVAATVLDKLQNCKDAHYIAFTGAGLKDIILPGDIRDIMNTVLIAEKNAQANVIARREEVASTRSLLNTAKLLDENATLYKLKELEYLERICDKVGSISVGGGNLLSELQRILSVTPRA